MHLRELDANLVVVLDALLTEASVTKAAARLGRSPSAISHSLANLRQLFSDELFVRAGQRLAPTAKAEQLAPTIHVIVAGIEGLLRPDTPFDPQSETGTYAIACPDILELTLLDRLRHALKADAPGLTVNWAPAHPVQCYADLRDGRTDIVLLEGDLSDNAADFRTSALFDDPFVTLAHPDHPLAGKALSVEQFVENEHVLLAPGTPGAQVLEAHLSAHGALPIKTTRASSAIVGMFVAWRSRSLITLPGSIVSVFGEQMPFQSVGQPFPAAFARYRMVWHSRLERDECHRWLRQQLVGHCGTAALDTEA